MPRIDTYTENTSIEDNDKLLTYDPNSASTKLTTFSRIWSWITSKLHALTSSGAALTPSTDRIIMDKNGTMTRVEPAAVAKYGIETYNGSTIAGSAQTVQSAINALNSKTTVSDASITLNYTVVNGAVYVRKFGNVVTVIIATKPSNETNIPAGNALFVIPQGYRPPIYLETVFRYGSNYPIVGVYDNGNVMASTAITGGTWIYATITYIVS